MATRRSLFAVALLMLALAPGREALAQSATLVADLDAAGPAQPASEGAPQGLVAVGDKVLFIAQEPSSGAELWVSDGTPQGTRLLRDLCPGTCGSSPQIAGAAGAVAFVFTQVGTSSEVWRTDGTRGGTFRVATPSTLSPHPSFPAYALTTKALFFAACEPATGCELWTTDGTLAGTHLVVDLYPGVGGSSPSQLRALGDRVYFAARSESGLGVWGSDGTAAGTVQLGGPFGGLDVTRMTATSSRLFFVAAENGQELWTSDGTPAGTHAVTSFAAADPQFGAFEASGELLLFVVDDVVGGRDLWQSDGTKAGTRRRTDFGYAYPFDFYFSPLNMERVGDHVLFVATDGLTDERLWTNGGTPASTQPLGGCPDGCPVVDHDIVFWRLADRVLFFASDGDDTALWSSDGTGVGTRKVRQLCAGDCGTGGAVAGGRFFFAELSNDGGEQHARIWSSDGSSNGTTLVVTLAGGPTGSDTAPMFVAAGGGVFFSAYGYARGGQLWRIDGSSAEVVADLPRQPASSDPTDLVAFGDGVLFVACDGEQVGLWASGGTAASTHPLPGTFESCFNEPAVRHPTVVGQQAFFVFHSRTGSPELWRTDGSAAGTSRLAGFAYDDRVESLVEHQGKLAFAVWANGRAAIWVSDGTSAGTHELLDLPDLRLPFALTSAGADLWFLAYPQQSPAPHVWRFDGTPGGLHDVGSLPEYSSFPEPAVLTRLGSAFYFLASTDNWSGAEVWRADATSVRRVAPDQPGGAADDVETLVAFQGKLYFFASLGTFDSRRALWRCDGTAAGTTLVAAVAPTRDLFGQVATIAVAPGALFFVANDGVHGDELWTSDGTAAGTRLVRDVVPGPVSSRPAELAVAGGRLFFSAHDGEHGVELWESDGTTAGTRMVQDLAPGAVSSHPKEITAAAGDRVFFAADDGVWGREPWTLSLAASGCQPSPAALCLGGGRYKVEASWRDFTGHSGAGTGVSLTADTGYFWFFGPENVEVVLKVLDGSGVNGHVWVFYGALSSVEYTLTVTDTATGAARRYVNPADRLSSVADTVAFGPLGATPSTIAGASQAAYQPLPAASKRTVTAIAPCIAGPTRLCLNGGRFAVEARWTISTGSGSGQAVPLTADTGYLWFFGAENVELIVKVLDGRAVNGKYWVFFGALSDVDYTLTVTDTQTGAVREYHNPQGRVASVADTSAF